MVDFWQARLPQWQPHHRHAAAKLVLFLKIQARQWSVLLLMAAQVLVRIVDRGVLEVPEHPGIVRFRKGDRKKETIHYYWQPWI